MNSNARTIEVIIHIDGSTRIQANGFTGRQCVVATHVLEQSLGLRSGYQRTAEFFHQSTGQDEQEFEKP